MSCPQAANSGTSRWWRAAARRRDEEPVAVHRDIDAGRCKAPLDTGSAAVDIETHRDGKAMPDGAGSVGAEEAAEAAYRRRQPKQQAAQTAPVAAPTAPVAAKPVQAEEVATCRARPAPQAFLAGARQGHPEIRRPTDEAAQ